MGPTLEICDYNVTMTTYRHPKLVVHDTVDDKETDIHPVAIGPILIHSH